ncbi:MAG: hypothetical protein EZS28_010779 [Streblomastix strix]|uniref:Uncharacterized protein n=1 Tax=Streblomastix strix TaxID=222440 RepID=A0A5J4WH56_9EUKA|nr:MAG: hypothetical protein EZS28_010779 [Streblomastix strix]
MSHRRSKREKVDNNTEHNNDNTKVSAKNSTDIFEEQKKKKENQIKSELVVIANQFASASSDIDKQNAKQHLYVLLKEKDEELLNLTVDKMLNILLCDSQNEVKDQINLTKKLELIEQITEKGALMADEYEQNKFHQQFVSSGLDKVIEIMITQKMIMKVDKKEKQKHFEELTQITLVYCEIMKYQSIQQESILNNIMKVIEQNLINILQNIEDESKKEIKRQKQREKEKSKKKAEDSRKPDDIEKEMIIQADIEDKWKILTQKSSRVLNCLAHFAENYVHLLVENQKIHKSLIPLVHINCPPELKCKKNLVLPNNDSTQQLQSSIFKALQIIAGEDEVQIILVEQHNILAHMRSLTISFQQQNSRSTTNANSIQLYSNSQHHQINQSKNINSNLFLSPLVIEQALKLYDTVLINLIPPKSERAAQQDVINALIALTCYKRNSQYQTQQESEQEIMNNNTSIIIIEKSLQCLRWMDWYGGSGVQNILVEQRLYIPCLIQSISQCGGVLEQRSRVNKAGLTNIEQLFAILSRGGDWCVYQPIWYKSGNEQFEEQGGLEEVESHLFHSGQTALDICQTARRAKRGIFKLL